MASEEIDYKSLETPEHCYVDFCLLPLGTATPSVSCQIAEVQKLIRASGLKHSMHSAGTTVEGSWDEVLGLVGRAHALMHRLGIQRVQTSMRAGTRSDKKQTMEDKVQAIHDILDK